MPRPRTPSGSEKEESRKEQKRRSWEKRKKQESGDIVEGKTTKEDVEKRGLGRPLKKDGDDEEEKRREIRRLNCAPSSTNFIRFVPPYLSFVLQQPL